MSEMILSSLLAELLRLSFTLDGAEHPVNNDTKTATAKQVKNPSPMTVGLGLPPKFSVPKFRENLWGAGRVNKTMGKVEKIRSETYYFI